MKKTIAAGLLLLICLIAGSAAASVWSYSVLEDGTIRINDFYSSEYTFPAEAPGKLIVPETIKGHYVTEMTTGALWASDDAGITEICLPKTLKKICSSGEGYSSCYLTVPSTVKAFSVDEENEYFSVKDGLLYFQDTLIRCPPQGEFINGELSIPENTSAISNGAFFEVSGIKSLRIPVSVTKMMESFFTEFGPGDLVLPHSLEEIIVDPGNPVFHSTEGALYEGTTLLAYPSGRTARLFTVENGTTSIEYGAFASNGYLESVTLPESLKTINSNAFYCMHYLKSINLPAGLTNIEDAAFDTCRRLDNCTIADGNTKFRMEKGALIRSDSQTLIAMFSNGAEIPEGIRRLGPKAYTNYPDTIESLTIPDSVTEIGEWCFHYTDLKQVTLPSTLQKWNDAFYYCKTLTRVDIPEGITEIPDGAFKCCKSLQTAVLPQSLTRIGEESFCLCEKLEDITIPDHVISIGKEAFYGCSGAEKLTVPAGTIGQRAFSNWSNLKEVTFLQDVTEIMEDAFTFCENLKTVYFQGGEPVIGTNAFAWCNGLRTVYYRNCFPHHESNSFGYGKSNAVAIVNNPAGSKEIDTGSMKQMEEYIMLLTSNEWKAESSTEPQTDAFLKKGGQLFLTFKEEPKTKEKSYFDSEKRMRWKTETTTEDILLIRMITSDGKQTEKEILSQFDNGSLRMYDASAVWEIDAGGKLILSNHQGVEWTLTFEPVNLQTE